MRIYDSRDPECKTPFGAVKTGEEVEFTVRLPKAFLADAPVLKVYEIDNRESPTVVPMVFCGANLSENRFSCKFKPSVPAVYAYCFEFISDGRLQYIKRGNDGAGCIGEHGDLWQLTVYDAKMQAPSFLREGVIYQIFPDRFANSGEPKQDVPTDRVLRGDWNGIPTWRPQNGEVLNNDYFGGDFKGIEQKLDYLAGLGVTAIYLNPIFEAHANHRYNTADYTKVDPVLGTNEDFERLAAAAKEKGISLILDGVFSHTGSDSVYFNKNGRYGNSGAYQDPDSPYREWYSFINYPTVYESWWGFVTLPNVRETNPDYLEYINGENGILAQWLKRGAAGFRLDVADELPDEFLDKLNERVKEFSPDAVIIGEVWEDATTKMAYGVRRRYLLGKQLDSVMNYPFKDAILGYVRWGGGDFFLNVVMQILENYPKPAIQCLMNSISTHDIERAITALAGPPKENHDREWQERHHYLSEHDYTRGVSLFKLASILQFGLPGMPCVYYGDEAGLTGYRDPFNRCCYPWGHENTDLVGFISQLGKMRHDYPVFAEADFIPVTFSFDVCCFARTHGSVSIIFAVNRGAVPHRLSLPDNFAGAEVLVCAGEYHNGALGAFSGVVLVSKTARD